MYKIRVLSTETGKTGYLKWQPKSDHVSPVVNEQEATIFTEKGEAIKVRDEIENYGGFICEIQVII